MLDQFKKILINKSITTVFQPIIDVQSHTILGYEALSRGPQNSELFSPDVLFQFATDYGLLSKLEILCRDNAIKCFTNQALQGMLFLNVSPMVLLDKAHPQGETIKLVQSSGLSCEQIVIELSEKYPFPYDDMLKNALDKYKQFGFKVAIDDLGAGYSGLKQWSQLRPDIVKIDRYFVENCHQDDFKAKFIKAMFDLGDAANSKVIVEGIETKEEYDCLFALGMRYVQGYYLARPVEFPIKNFNQLRLNLKNTVQAA